MTREMLSVATGNLDIGTPAGASETMRFAAEQLAYYLAIITGERFPCVEGHAFIELAADLDGPTGAYAIDTSDDGIRISGDCELSLLHGVYHFLEEQCGCRWLSSSEGGEIVPRDERLAVPVGLRTRVPAFAHRAFTNFPDIDDQTVDMVDWMCKNRFERFMVFANVDGAFERYQEVLKPHLVLRGMKVEVGHHSFRYWLPPTEFFADHPEWFAMQDGERSQKGQLCTSNPDVAKVVSERICEFLTENSEIAAVGLWPNDGYGWCECEQCRAEEPQRPLASFGNQPARTDTYMKFVNRVAEKVASQHPDRRIGALAYVNYVEPPTCQVHPSVDVCFAAMHRCFKHPFQGAEDCTRDNSAYANHFLRWRDVAPGKLYVFCYLMQIDTCSVLYPIHGMLGPNFRWLARHGCDGYVMEYKPEEWGTFGSNAYLIGRLSWDPNMDVEDWLRSHCGALYGPAAEEMFDFLDVLRRRFVELGPCTFHYDLSHTRRATPELLKCALRSLGEARAKASAGERRHIEAVERAHVALELLVRIGQWQRAFLEARKTRHETLEVLRNRSARLAAEVVEWARSHASSGALFAPRIEMIVQRAEATLDHQPEGSRGPVGEDLS